MNKAFTLIELLAVITLLGLIAVIAVPTIDKALQNSKDSLTKTQEKQIIAAAKNYYSEHLSELKEGSFITLKTLKEQGYLDNEDIKNPKTNKTYSDNSKVTVTIENNKYTYTIVLEEEG